MLYNHYSQWRFLCEASNIKDPVLKAIEKCKRHPSIKAMAGLSKNDNFI